MKDFLSKLNRINETHAQYVIVTIVDARGSLPQEIGAKMIISPKGILYGTVGGGKIEAWAIDQSQKLLINGSNNYFKKINLQKDIGMSCGGEAQLYFEVISEEKWSVAIFGAGHIAQALIPVLSTLNCQIYCIDTRDEWLAKLPNFSNIKKIKVMSYIDGVSTIPHNSYVLTMTMGHSYDFPVLKEVLTLLNFPYIGGIGSLVKSIKIKKELIEAGLTEEQVQKFECPIGLKIGNNTPSEISISIIARLLDFRDSV